MVPHNHCCEVVHSKIGEEFLCLLSLMGLNPVGLRSQNSLAQI